MKRATSAVNYTGALFFPPSRLPFSLLFLLLFTLNHSLALHHTLSTRLTNLCTHSTSTLPTRCPRLLLLLPLVATSSSPIKSTSGSAANGKASEQSPSASSMKSRSLTPKPSSNLLYPKEDRVTSQLMFTCRTCHVGEPASSYCVYQNTLNSQVGDTAGVTQDVGSDPTVGPHPGLFSCGFLSLPGFCTCCGRELECSVCGNKFFKGPVTPTQAALVADLENLEMEARSRRSSSGST